jgi:hypothetical protein
MFELIVLGVVLAGLTAIVCWPGPKHRTENRTPSAPGPWTPQTDCRQFHRPTYLRRGIAADGSRVRSAAPAKRLAPSGQGSGGWPVLTGSGFAPGGSR